ncbi:tellurite resistance TerB family protein [Nonlabens antarcticus]|uniref:tellurite resistance TerB family protein n=1 Tax=Nonlabens antarcticus TaxID=392714 RepID=UPI001891730B|nr:TerB family tellurite resistance protein [Nonlabens antarcticus]
MNSIELDKRYSHLSALLAAAKLDGVICEKEISILKRIAGKMGIEMSEFDVILNNPEQYPIIKCATAPKQLHRLFEMFQIIFIDNQIDEEEREMVYHYAIALGMPKNRAARIIDNSIELFMGQFTFEDYTKIVDVL